MTTRERKELIRLLLDEKRLNKREAEEAKRERPLWFGPREEGRARGFAECIELACAIVRAFRTEGAE